MSVHYRFKSALEYDTITFDGLHISVKDLKNSILQQKRIGRSTDFDLLITNAQTQEVYKDENTLIPKNTSLLIARIPLTVPKPKQWEGYGGNDTPPSIKMDDIGPIGKAVDLANLDAPEDDKIKAMMTQSTQEYDPSNYLKIRGANQVGPVPASYRCYKCHQNGHWIKDCPLGQGTENLEIKKSTGIPQSFMVPVEGPQVPGAMMMSNGQYAVPALDYQAYSQKNTAPPPVVEPKPEIPEDLVCSICSDLLADAVMIPCCGNSFCDECIRSVLLESEEHECPDCHEKDISPATLIPNRFLRKSVANFKNTTGYEKKPVYKPKSLLDKEAEPKKEATPPPVVDSTEKEHQKLEQKTVISEADSTEHTKNETDFSKEIDEDSLKTDDVKGPPGVSPPPSESPKHQITSNITNTNHRVKNDRDKEKDSKQKRRSESPKQRRHRRSPSYEKCRSEERQGTPTRDEPPGIGTNYIPPTSSESYNSGIATGALPGSVIGPMQGPPPTNLPPGVYAPPGQQPPLGNYPPVQGPPPNFRIPPPGTQPAPFLGPGPYPIPPRPLYDPTRPPLGGPPAAFPTQYTGRARDYNRGRGIRERTPPGVIDDPLAAFNRILREKDEKRARQQRLARRSWSRSRSRSRTFSRSPPPSRRRSRTPRRRSRSRSFSISRSRSRSYSKSPRGSSPAPPRRSPPSSLQLRRDHARFRSPVRSPPHRRRNDRERSDYDRSGFREKPRSRRGDSRDRYYDDRDREYDRTGNRAPTRGPPPAQPQWTGQREPYYPPPHDQQGLQTYQNRYQPRDYLQNIPLQRKYEEIAPPGIDQPPVPGLETEPPPVCDFVRDRKTPELKEKETERNPTFKDEDRDKRDKPRRRDERKSRSRVVSPEKWRNPSPKSKDESPSRRRTTSTSNSRDDKRRDRDRERDKDYLELDKRRGKDKKKHKERKEEKKRKKDKKEKHHKRVEKDKKDKKDEFKQVIPKGEEDSEENENVDDKRKVDEKLKTKKSDDFKKQDDRRSRDDEEKERERELKKQAEEHKKEERRLRFIEDEKRKREEEARKEEAKRKAIEEARRALEEEELAKSEKEEKEVEPTLNLYDKIIPEKDVHKEVVEDFGPMKYDSMLESKDVVMENQGIFSEDVAGEPENSESEVHKEVEEEDNSILELHSDTDIKLEDSDILAPVPEKSKWEVDEDGQIPNSPKEYKEHSNIKPAKVSNEVLKRAENVIFARAINSIRPIEIKKISSDRAVLYADDKKDAGDEIKTNESFVEKPRLSVKDRLGVKVNDPDPRISLLDNRRSKSPSPFSRRERRIEIQEHRRPDRHRSRSRKREYSHDKDKRRERSDKMLERQRRPRRDDRERPDDRREKRRRSLSRSDSEERKRKRKDKKPKKEKEKTKKQEGDIDIAADQAKPKSATEKRKPTVDEVNFEPDYDLELHDEEVASEIDKIAKKHKEARRSEADDESSSSESTSSSSEEERRKKKKKKHKKKKRRDSSSSSTESSGDSSDSEKDRKRKKHKKAKKKKKKSKHK
ncbi:uncharacterized protein LOC143189929 isoform X2 [Rhynchophorus ferrugineus]|uniref:uncharacterized protein LOC143189929 isoform X2 n=1 Tax=Rhynchophorus ferrugineus TaxID=354439 RepID=UPI003FCD2063